MIVFLINACKRDIYPSLKLSWQNYTLTHHLYKKIRLIGYKYPMNP